MMRLNYLSLSFLFLCVSLWLFSACNQSAKGDIGKLPAQVDFNYHIKPILSDRCFTCHGPDANAREADLRLDTEEGAFAALKNQDGAFAIVAGNKNKSEIWHRIVSEDPEYQMPPPESNLTISPREIALIGKWIDQGAAWKKHWSFIPPEKLTLPKIRKVDWPQKEIDHFVLARLEREGLQPADEAAKEKWLRRVSFDLTGLPPSLEDLDAFLADESENAYEKKVDALLASPAYGERMASVWLDAARYADSHGYQDDRPRTMWPWRDWVIDAFNRNMPYDTFLTWQIAGDLLPNASYEQKLATGFNRNHGITQEGGVVNEEYITEYVADRTNTFSTAILGLTMECARCHEHKYDPLSQKNYYQLFAFFNTLDERGQINYFDEAPKPNMRVEDPELEAKKAWIDSIINITEKELVERLRKPEASFTTWANNDLPKLNPKEILAKGLISKHIFDQLDGLRTPNQVQSGFEGKANTGLVSALEVPELVEGKNGQALQFDGHNFIEIGGIGDFEWYDDFSFGCWFKGDNKVEEAASLLSKRNGEQKRGGYELIMLPDRKLQASFIHNRSSERITVQTRSKVPKGSWSHAMITYDGSGRAEGVSIYLNGKVQRTKIIQDELQRKSILNGNDFLVGNWTPRNLPNGQLQGFTDGIIDEVVVYDRILSPWEVSMLVSNESKPKKLSDAYPFYLQSADQDFIRKANVLDSLKSEYREIPYVMIMEEADSPRSTFLLDRGAYDAPTEQVYPSTPDIILPFPASLPKNRLGLAQWLCLPEHPLTARVMVNRCWQMVFGRGLVNTMEDFGSQGALPSHPALLDWLAVDFVESGWDVKALMKKIVLSATYRQSAKIPTKLYQQDRDNILLARGPNQRFSAEMIRDNAMAVSGLLNPIVGGHWVKPYQPDGVWKALANQIGENKYRPSTGSKLYRRSLYSYWKRTIPPPMMLTFDAAERTVCVVKRQSTSTPLQALVLLNDPQFIEASRVLAARMLKEGGESLESRINWGFRAVTSRLPQQAELQALMDLNEELVQAQKEGNLEEVLLSQGDYPIPDDLEKVELLVYTVIANTLFNLDEAKMKS